MSVIVFVMRETCSESLAGPWPDKNQKAKKGKRSTEYSQYITPRSECRTCSPSTMLSFLMLDGGGSLTRRLRSMA